MTQSSFSTPRILAAGLCALAVGCSAVGTTGPRPRHLVVVTLDTARADRLSPYGFMDVVMPGLDRLAAEGVVFDQAISVAPLTLPAHSSLFTAKFPPHHGVRDNGDRPLPATETTLSEVLKGAGYRTAAFVASAVLNADRGLAQGFDEYDDLQANRDGSRERRADEVIDAAEAWLDRADDGPFFLWAHLYDPHRPYDPPHPFRRVRDPYVGEIAFADSQILRLLRALERRNLLDETIFVVAGDHGESLGEHGERDHGIFVYEAVLRVPLIVRAPGVQPRRVASVVRLVDVMPTVLDLLGVAAASSDGVTLLNAMQGRGAAPDLEAYAESLYPQRFGWSALRTLRDGRFKLIDAPRPELYDLARDPFENRNIHGERPALAHAMTRRLAAFGSATRDPAPEALLPPDLRGRLAALGYVGTGPTPLQLRAGLPDPKDQVRDGTLTVPPRATR